MMVIIQNLKMADDDDDHDDDEGEKRLIDLLAPPQVKMLLGLSL